jgi:lambda family phage minor tail protein L
MTSASMFQVVRNFGVGVLITLYRIDLTKQGGGLYYFTNNIFEERVPISFAGQEYVHMPIAMEGVDVSAEGGSAQPRLTIATAGGPVNALIRQYKDLRGAKVWRTRTFAEFLDKMPNGAGGVMANPSADGAARLPEDLFVIDRKVGANKTMAEFQLISPTDQEGVMIPLRVVKRRFCDLIYRFSNGDGTFTDPPLFVDGGCPYRGSAYYDVNDKPVTASLDRCSKTLKGCTLRFGKTAALPFSAYPGVKSQGEA